MNLLYRSSDLNKIPIRIIESDHALTPAVRHEPIHILCIGIELFEFFHKSVNIRLFKIQLVTVTLRNHIPVRKLFPVSAFLQINLTGQLHISIVILNQR